VRWAWFYRLVTFPAIEQTSSATEAIELLIDSPYHRNRVPDIIRAEQRHSMPFSQPIVLDQRRRQVGGGFPHLGIIDAFAGKSIAIAAQRRGGVLIENGGRRVE